MVSRNVKKAKSRTVRAKPPQKNSSQKKAKKQTTSKQQKAPQKKATLKLVQPSPVQAMQSPSAESEERRKLLDLVKQPKVRDYLTLSGGHDSLPLIEAMMEFENGEVDTVLANKLDMKVTVVRTLLNRLHYKGIVEYSRTKDEEIGWYTYKWSVRKNEMVNELVTRIKEELEREREKAALTENHLQFACPANCHKVVFEVAAEYKFRCPDCSDEMRALDNEAESQRAREKIRELEGHLDQLQTLS